MLKKVSVTLAVFACLLIQFVNGLYGGFAYGASKMCDVSYPSSRSHLISFWISHADPYFYLSNYLIYLTYSLLIFIIGKLVERGITSQFLSFLPLVSCLFFFGLINGELNLVLNDSDPYIDLLRESIHYNWTVFSIVVTLLILQIVTVSKSLYEKYKATPK